MVNLHLIAKEGISISLFDVDKHSDDRSNPDPNRPDTIADGNIMSKNTISTSYATPATTTPTRIIYKNNMTLTYDSAGRVSSVYGYVASVSSVPVIIIAKAGYDVFVDILGIPAPTL